MKFMKALLKEINLYKNNKLPKNAKLKSIILLN